MKLKIKNNKKVLITNGTFIDFGNEVTNEIIEVMKANKVNPKIMSIVISITTDVIAGIYRKMFGSCTDDDIDLIEE